MLNPSELNWQELENFANELNEPDAAPVHMEGMEFLKIKKATEVLLKANDWNEILRLRDMFDEVISEDAISVLPIFLSLNDSAIQAAKIKQSPKQLAHYLAAKGQNLHRMGQHADAIVAFRESYNFYISIDEKHKALESLHMTALCLRPLGETREARKVILDVMGGFDDDDPFLGHPLRTLGWLERDAGNFPEAEALIRKSLDYHLRGNAPENIIAETLSDLAEIVGLRDNYSESKRLFEESLSHFAFIGSKVVRQVARAQSKYAELELRKGNFDRALELLNEAVGLLRAYGPYYDQIWKIEMLSVNIHLRKGEVLLAFRKFLSALSAFQKTKMKPRDFIRQVVNRTKIGSGIKKLSSPD